MTNARTEKSTLTSLPSRRFAFPTQATFLSQAVLLEEAGPPRIPALACLLGFAAVSVAIVAGMLIKIDVVSSNSGQIISSSANHVLQSFDGGIVDQIYVEEGQVVNEGDLLLSLHDPEAKAQLRRLKAREASLGAQAQRLQTLADLSVAQPASGSSETAVLKIQQMAILPLEQAAMTAERSLVKAEIKRRTASLSSLRSLREHAISKVAVIYQKVESQRHLYANGLAPKVTLLEAEREVKEAEFELAEIEGQLQEAEASILESRRRLDDVVASRKQRQGDQLSSIMLDLGETQEQINAAMERLERGSVRANVRGIVQELAARHPGQTIAPAEKIVEIIPIDVELIAEVRLPTPEISHIHKGQPVRIAIDGMEPHRHGYLQGAVRQISASTFVDESAIPYFRTVISLEADELGDVPLTPGMTIQAQIKTHQRTMLEYLLKPVYRAWETAFRER